MRDGKEFTGQNLTHLESGLAGLASRGDPAKASCVNFKRVNKQFSFKNKNIIFFMVSPKFQVDVNTTTPAQV